ncbi:MAG: Spx/MgsR family RNA polymerase-binding regulatory protein [Opitutaceae bacterium]
MSARAAKAPWVVYTYSSCDTCRKATRWLREHGQAFEERPIRDTPPTPVELARALKSVEGDRGRLFNRSGRDYRDQGLAELLPGWSDAEVIKRLAANGNLVKRPLLLGDRVVLIGFDEQAWAAALG